MAVVKLTDREGVTTEIEAQAGSPLLDIIQNSGNCEIEALCGGSSSCATCHIFVDEAWLYKLPVPSDTENMLVQETLSYRENSRLSCQVIFAEALDGMPITIAPED